MAIVVDKTIQMSEVDIIRYQLLTHCFINSLKLSNSELDCLLLLIQNGECDLSEFSRAASSKDSDDENISLQVNPIFKTPQTVRNFLTRAEKQSLIVKSDGSRKKIKINPDIDIQFGGTVLLNYKIFYRVSQKS